MLIDDGGTFFEKNCLSCRNRPSSLCGTPGFFSAQNMNKIIKPRGYLLLGVPYQMRYWTVHDKIWGHYRRYEEKELREKLESTGFEVQKVRHYGYPLAKWFYFSVFLPAAKRKKKIITKKKLPFYYYALYILRYLFLIDYFFDSKKEATNLLVIAKKKS